MTGRSTKVHTTWGFTDFQPLPGGPRGAMGNVRGQGCDRTRFVCLLRSLGAGVQEISVETIYKDRTLEHRKGKGTERSGRIRDGLCRSGLQGW